VNGEVNSVTSVKALQPLHRNLSIDRLSEMIRKYYLSLLLLTVLGCQLAAIAPVNASSTSILVYSHGFAKAVQTASNGNLILINQTTVFTQDDLHAYAYALAAFYSANVTWEWDDPSGQQYSTATYPQDCTASPCYIYSRLDILKHPPATRFGRWTVTLWNGNQRLYTDSLYITAVVTEENHWSFTVSQSKTPSVRGNLTVTIHPNNGTWTYYQIYLPYAANLTAVESGTNRTLIVTNSTGNLAVVDFGTPRSDGYTFSILFDLKYGLNYLNGYNGGVYDFNWAEWPWQRFNDPHPVYETFRLSLPASAELIDVIGQNAININYETAPGATPTIVFDTTDLQQVFGWTVIYRDTNGLTSSPNAIVNPVPIPTIPILPLTLNDLNIWSAAMSVFLLIASELASPLYAVTGSRILVNRRRLRIAGLVLVVVFLVSTGYRLSLQFNTVPK